MPKRFLRPSEQDYLRLRNMLASHQPSLALQAAEAVVVRMDMLETKGRATITSLLPWAQRGVSQALVREDPRYATVTLDAATLRLAFARVARRRKGGSGAAR